MDEHGKDEIEVDRICGERGEVYGMGDLIGYRPMGENKSMWVSEEILVDED
jgi:hypothetical protein